MVGRSREGLQFTTVKLSLETAHLLTFKTEDALNIISSIFSISDCKFSDHYSDAFDGDFVVAVSPKVISQIFRRWC